GPGAHGCPAQRRRALQSRGTVRAGRRGRPRAGALSRLPAARRCGLRGPHLGRAGADSDAGKTDEVAGSWQLSMTEIDALLKEERRFPPSDAWRANANIAGDELDAPAAADRGASGP